MHYLCNATKICDNHINLSLGLYNKFIWSKQLKGILNILLTIVIMNFEASPIENAYVSFFV